MIVSSRTPEGQPNHCPVCGQAVVIDPSLPLGDAPCPHCGVLLFFVQIGSQAQTFAYPGAKSVRDRVLDLLADKLGVDRATLEMHPTMSGNWGADSLDLVELVMELEEEFGADETVQ